MSPLTALTGSDDDLGASRRWSVPVVRSAVAFVAQLDLFIVKDHPNASRRIGLETLDHHGAKHDTETAGQPYRTQHDTVV